MKQNDMDLRKLLELLPDITEDGVYFELRKNGISNHVWSCVETNMKTYRIFSPTSDGRQKRQS